MGRKKTVPPEDQGNQEPPKAAEPASKDPDSKEDADEDLPIIKELKAVDDKYLEVEREYEKELNKLELKYEERRAPIFDQRFQLLATGPASDMEEFHTGTPGMKGFWLRAMKNVPTLGDLIETWDAPVLEYLSNITRSNVDPEDTQKGFRISFHFVKNPYFANDVLWKEYHTKESSPYTGDIDTTEIRVCEIEWKPGKNVTVEITKKKIKGGGAKKAKQKAKEMETPRDSFFRNFWRDLKPGMPIPDDVNLGDQLEDSDDEDDDMIEALIEHDYDMGMAIRDQLIPFAIRWWTGEARPENYDSEEDEEEEEEVDDDYEDEEEEREPAPKKKAQPKKKGGGGGDDKKKAAGDGPDQRNPEECKQQ